MSHIRFNHVFFWLMVLAAISAFLAPRVSERAQAQLQMLFIPVAKPMHAFGGWTHDKLTPQTVRDDGSPHAPRDVKELVRENADLRMQLVNVTGELDRLRELNADRSKLGDLRARCTPADVIAGDSGSLESLQLSSGSVSGLRDDMPVLCPDGIVGRLTKVGITSSRVKLITDKGSKVTVSFVRFDKDKTGVTQMSNVTYPDSVAEGQGGKQLLVTHQRLHDLKDLQTNDWAVLNDPDWPRLSYRVGRVVAVEPQKDAPSQFGQIRIESVVDLNLLKEVMVLTK